MVLIAYTIVNPRAVVVKTIYTSVANGAMPATVASDNLAYRAKDSSEAKRLSLLSCREQVKFYSHSMLDFLSNSFHGLKIVQIRVTFDIAWVLEDA